MVNSNCRACRYFLDSSQAIGTCRRFPTYQTRSPNEWCGEFVYQEPEIVALPVVEMQQEKRKYTRKKHD